VNEGRHDADEPDVTVRNAIDPQLPSGIPHDPRGTVVTVGTFDGIHRGHWAVLQEIRRRAKATGRRSVLLTFHPHPLTVLRPDKAPRMLTTPTEKKEILAEVGLDFAVFLRFSQVLASYSPERFVEEILVARLGVTELVVGYDHHFGRGRAGDLEALRALGERHGFAVRQVEALSYDGAIISSSRIRQSLMDGDVEQAGLMLGRPFFVQGTVIEGDGRGRLMGFPTANVKVDGDVLIGDGVYVTDAIVDGESHHGMTHVGRRPTFGLDERMVETHLFDFDREIYGAVTRLYFHQRIRGTVAFDSAEALKVRLEEDEREARSFFSGRGRNLVL